MLKKRNAQGLSITMIVVAVVALIVVVVMIAVFSGKMGSFKTASAAAVSCNAVCAAVGYNGGVSGSGTPGIVDTKGNACSCTK